MDKKQFIEQVIHDVRSIPVSTVLGSRMHLIYRGGYNKGLCPFHNDNKIGSFVATDKKQIWKCFSCGVGGDTIKFVAEYDAINYLESTFKLALEYNIISQSEYDEYFTRRRYKKEDIQRIQRRYEELDKAKFQNNIATPEILDKVFRILIDVSPLNEEHKKHLMEVRGLSEKEIQEGLYFTFPTRRKMATIAVRVKEAFEEGTDILETIPGFFFNKSDNLWTFATNKGIGIGIKNARGQVVGIQIRHDEKKEETAPRYVWFSSSFAMYNDEKFDCGTSSGSPVDVVYPEVINNTTVFITEGRFKAQQLAKEKGSIVLSVQGVTTWRGIVDELQSIKFSPIAKQRYYKKDKPYDIQVVLVAFDADMNYKYQVFQQLRSMTNQLENKNYNVYYLNWNEQLGKGIDDVILNGHIDDIKRYDKEVWDKAYDEMLKVLIDNEEYAEMKDVPEEVLRKYFYQEMAKVLNHPLDRNQLSRKHQLAKAK